MPMTGETSGGWRVHVYLVQQPYQRGFDPLAGLGFIIMRAAVIPPDLRYAVRSVLGSRLFTAVSVLCLALGIGANITMFSVFDAMFLRPLPFPNPDRLVAITGHHPGTNRRVTLSLNDISEITRGLRSIQTVAAYTGRTATLNDGGEAERIAVQQVTASF